MCASVFVYVRVREKRVNAPVSMLVPDVVERGFVRRVPPVLPRKLSWFAVKGCKKKGESSPVTRLFFA